MHSLCVNKFNSILSSSRTWCSCKDQKPNFLTVLLIVKCLSFILWTLTIKYCINIVDQVTIAVFVSDSF